MKNITELFLQHCGETPGKKAIIEKDTHVTFGELEDKVKGTASYFQSKGIQKGDRVLVFVPMSIDLYRIVLALFYLGATAVFIDEWSDRDRLKTCCKLADCKGFIGTCKARIFAFFSKPLRKIPIKLSKSGMKDEPVELVEVAADHPALITFTTGSTGTPKAALRTHSFLKDQFESLVDELAPHPDDLAMPLLPIVLFITLGFGCTSVIPNVNLRNFKKFKPEDLVAQIQKFSITQVTASPFYIRELAKYKLDQDLALPSITKIFAGGAPVFPKEGELYVNAFPKAEVTILYGSTEAEPVSSIPASELSGKEIEDHNGLPVGSIVPHASIRVIEIVDGPIECNSTADLKAYLLGEGEIGEIIVSGPHVLKHYFKNEEAFRQNKIQVEDTLWHRMGDAGFVKEDKLFLTGRKDQMILRKSEWISPFIIEARLQKLENVNAGTLIELDNKLVLCIESRLTKDELKTQVHDIPHDEIKLLDKIPRDPRHNAKIDYGALKENLR